MESEKTELLLKKGTEYTKQDITTIGVSQSHLRSFKKKKKEVYCNDQK